MRSEYLSKWKLYTIYWGNEYGDEVEKEGTSQSIVEIQQQFEALTLLKTYLDFFISFSGCYDELP